MPIRALHIAPLVAAALLAGPGCVEDLPLETFLFACESDADCPGGFCDSAAKVCVLPGQELGDIGGPGDGGDTADVDLGDPPTCDEYCDAVMSACGTEQPLRQYVNRDGCMIACENHFFNESEGIDIRGFKGDPTGNTLACRLSFAELASEGPEDAAKYCDAAGVSGGNRCGSWCDMYCHLESIHCDLFDGEEACQTACENFSTFGNPGDASGDSVQCRIYHMQAAGLDKPSSAETHCPHAGVVSADNQCVEPLEAPDCETYCETVMANCQGIFEQYPSQVVCEQQCEVSSGFPVGEPWETDTNTIGCRLHHAQQAGRGNPGFFCRWAAFDGGDVCGGWCDNYCYLSGRNCTGDNALYSDEDACFEACEGFDDDALSGSSEGDSVQCRLYHLSVAGSDIASGSDDTHCSHGAAVSTLHCLGDVDVPTCEQYCAQVTESCPPGGDNAQYTDEQACVDMCFFQMETGEFQDTSENTVGCRLFFSQLALSEPEEYCASAGPTGGDSCGSYCNVYCDLALSTCGGLYANGDECALTCATFDVGDDDSALTGDSVQCRLNNLLAGGDTACEAAGPDGGEVCVE